MKNLVGIRCGVRVISALALALAATAAVRGQNPDDAQDLRGLKIRQVHPVPLPTPFPLVEAPTGANSSEENHRAVTSLDYLPPDRMTPADAQLAAANASEIARRAMVEGFGAGLGIIGGVEDERAGTGAGWGYEQAVCPVFPDALVLEYSRKNGAGDISLFSVVIPRGAGHVRVIPVRRRSYSLWTPAPSNALTLHDFNAMVKQTGLSADWLTTGLCYAALAGGHVRAALRVEAPEDEHFPLFAPATLRLSRKGGAEMDFVDVSESSHGKMAERRAGSDESRLWTLEFAQDGRLLRVRQKAARATVARPVAGAPAEAQFPGK